MKDIAEEYEHLCKYLEEYRNNLLQKSELVGNTLNHIDDGRDDPGLEDLRNRKSQLDADIAYFDTMFGAYIPNKKVIR